MARCRICGEPIRGGVVAHSACVEEEKAKLRSLICDEYCKHVVFSADEEELEEECEKCKIAEMLG